MFDEDNNNISIRQIYNGSGEGARGKNKFQPTRATFPQFNTKKRLVDSVCFHFGTKMGKSNRKTTL